LLPRLQANNHTTTTRHPQRNPAPTTTNLGTIDTMAGQAGMIDPTIFEGLQTKIDEDTAIRDVRRSQKST
jgi:hypothetical protein